MYFKGISQEDTCSVGAARPDLFLAFLTLAYTSCTYRRVFRRSNAKGLALVAAGFDEQAA